MASGGFWERPYQLHAYPFEGDADDGEWALRKPLFFNLSQGVLRTHMSSQWVCVGQMRQELSFGEGDHQQIANLPTMLSSVIE